MRAAADDHDVVAVLELAAAAPHAALAEQVTHGRRLRRRRPPRRAAAEVAGRVGDHRPQVLAERGAEQHQVAVLGLAQDHARRAGDRAGPEGADRLHARAQVQRAEAGEDLARQRPEIASAAYAVVTRRTVRGTRGLLEPPAQRRRVAGGQITSARSRVSGHHQAPSRARGAVPQLERRRRRRRASEPGSRACREVAKRRSAAVPLRSPSKRDRDVPAVAHLEARAGRPRDALHRAARERRGAAERRVEARNSKLTSAAPRRRGRRTAA